MAAGHRACALCRREDYDRLVALWRDLHPGQVGADAMDAQLHGERVADGTRAQRHHDGAARRPPRRRRSSCATARRGSCAEASCWRGRRRGYGPRDRAAGERARAWSSRRRRWSRCCARAGEARRAAAAPVGGTAQAADARRRRRRARSHAAVGLVVGGRLDHHAHELLGAAGAHAGRARGPPARAASRSLASASSLLAIAASRSCHAHVDEPLGQLLHGVAVGEVGAAAAPRA